MDLLLAPNAVEPKKPFITIVFHRKYLKGQYAILFFH